MIACTGFAHGRVDLRRELPPELTIDDRFPALTRAWESVNVPDLYFAGTLTQSRDFKKYSSAFIKGFRYGTRALQRMLDRRYEGVPWPCDELPATPEAIAAAVLARINRTSGLWQQYSFLCDLVEITTDGARYYEEVPVDHVLDGGFGVADRFVTVTLEYGAGHDAIDPFDVEVGRAWEADAANDVRYLHPVLRYYQGARLVVGAAHCPRTCATTGRATTPTARRSATSWLLRWHRVWASSGGGEPVNVREFEAAARAVLDPVHFDYFAGGAQDEITVRANESAFGRSRWCPASCAAPAHPSWTSPCWVPTWRCRSSWRRPRSTASPTRTPSGPRPGPRPRPAVTMIAAMLSTVAIEDIAAESRKTAAEWEPTLWFQLYVQPDLGVHRSHRAPGRERRLPGAGRHRRLRRPRAAPNATTATTSTICLPDCAARTCVSCAAASRAASVQVVLSPDISWEHVDWLRGISDLPILLKGVLHPLDARLAVEHGVDGVDRVEPRRTSARHHSRDDRPAAADRRGRRAAPADAARRRRPAGHRRRQGTRPRRDRGGGGRPAVWGLAAGGEAGRRPRAGVAAERARQRPAPVRLRLAPGGSGHDLIGRLA